MATKQATPKPQTLQAPTAKGPDVTLNPDRAILLYLFLTAA